MKRLILFTFLIYGLNVSAQDLTAIYPINYPKTNSILQEDSSTFFEEFNISISKGKEVSFNGKLIYKCEFTEYYEYLIEVFKSDNDYLIVSPLPKAGHRGVATPYNIDRGLIFILHYQSDRKYYASLDEVKRIQIPEAFEFGKDQSHAFMIKEVDEESEELVLLQGGKEIKEVRIKMHKY